VFALPTLTEIENAAAEVNRLVPPTPQFTWPLLNERAGTEVWVKHENHTAIGAFKIRGALHYVRDLLVREPVPGLIAATRGNHGQAIAFAGRRHGLPVTIVVPRGNSVGKNRAMRALGAELIEHGEDFQAALVHAQQVARERSLHWVPSFDRALVCGNAGAALDFLRNAPPLDRVYVSIGMGSGVAAMAAARNAVHRQTRLIGVASEKAPAIARSFEARRVVAHPATTRIADGMACSTPHPDSLDAVLSEVERIVCVSDDEVEAAMRAYFSDTHNIAEGAAAAALAGVLREREEIRGLRVGVVLTGSNVDADVFARVLAAGGSAS
jgi:threonine dehydratase